MSITIDPRRGSGEFARLFGGFSIPIYLEYLNSADYAFSGNGPSGDISIGVERKALADFMTCMNDERFTGVQLDNLLKEYHYTFVVIEGVYRPSIDGFIEVCKPIKDRFGNENEKIMSWRPLYEGSKKRPTLYAQLEGHINTLRLKAGMSNAGFLVANTTDALHTTWMVANLYRWFNKPWIEHQSHIGFYDPASLFRGKSSFEMRLSMQFDGVGIDRANMISKAFPGIDTVTSPLEQMMAATEKDWAQVEGIGKTTAEKIYRQLHGRNEVKEPKKAKKKKE